MTFTSITGVGRVVRKPELRYTTTGKKVVDVDFAVDDGFGENKSTVWMRLTYWERTAEVAAEHLEKGDLFAFTASLQQKEVLLHQGTDRERRERKTTLKGRDLHLLPNDRAGRESRRDARGGLYNERPPEGARRPAAPPADGGQGFPPGTDQEDEIDF